jgi:hypothetical protein
MAPVVYGGTCPACCWDVKFADLTAREPVCSFCASPLPFAVRGAEDAPRPARSLSFAGQSLVNASSGSGSASST